MVVEQLIGWALRSLPAIGLLFVGYVVERHYVSRVTCFTNALALYVYVLDIPDPSRLLMLYTGVGLLVGLLGMGAYLNHTTLGWWYYDTAFLLYASGPVGAVVLLPTPFLPTLIVAGILNFAVSVLLWKDGFQLVYDDAIPAETARFLRKHTVDSKEYRDGIDLLVRL